MKMWEKSKSPSQLDISAFGIKEVLELPWNF
jgi:hypothetical protein